MSEGIKQYLPQKNLDETSSESLFQLTLDFVAQHFNEYGSQVSKIAPQLLNQILNELDIQHVDSHVGAEFIHNEHFFKRAALQTYGSGKCVTECHGLSWKRLYYERMLQDMLMNRIFGEGDDSNNEAAQVTAMAKAIQNYVFSLVLDRNKVTDLFLADVFKALPNLTSLVFTIRDVNTNLLQISHLGRALQNTSCLCMLSLSNCDFDDARVKELIDSLSNTHTSGNILDTLVHLDISHNRITTNGLELILGHFVHTNEQPNGDNEITTRNDPILTVLNLSGNKIDSIGGRILGQMLQQNHSLIILNVNLNYLQDEGGLSLLRGLRDNCTLQCLEIASNQLSSQSASTLSSIIENHSPRSTKSNGPSSSGERNSTKKTMSNLEEVDLAANCFSEKDIIKFSKSMQGNCNLKLFDLRSQQPPQGHYKHFDEEIKTTKSLKMYENALENISKRLRMNKKSG